MESNRLPGAVAVAVVASLLSTAAAAQWLNYPTPGIPRLPDGKPVPRQAGQDRVR
jgi:hypothetical protein